MKKRLFEKEPTQIRLPRKLDTQGFPKYGPRGQAVYDLSNIFALVDVLRGRKEK